MIEYKCNGALKLTRNGQLKLSKLFRKPKDIIWIRQSQPQYLNRKLVIKQISHLKHKLYTTSKWDTSDCLHLNILKKEKIWYGEYQIL